MSQTTEEGTLGKTGKTHAVEREFCPFINKPFENCYCFNMNSLKTESAIRYCGGKFRECAIYMANMPLRQMTPEGKSTTQPQPG